MANLIAIDWDSHQLRAVLGRSGSSGVTINDTATVELRGNDPVVVQAALSELLQRLDVPRSKTKLLVALGRGKAELRQLNLPPVPADELPALVRFQALQSFSSGGEGVAVDYLPVDSSEQSTSVIAGGVMPSTMKQIQQLASGVSLELSRVALRPVAAAALYSLNVGGGLSFQGDCVLVDLLADDAEIVIFRGGKVVFVRSVRMPEQASGRAAQIGGEIRRSLMASGSDAASDIQRIIIWGHAETHAEEARQLHESLNIEVETLDPLALVGYSQPSTGDDAGQRLHTGRLAPLVGLLVADAAAHARTGQSPFLVDFLNPRKAVEKRSANAKWYGISGVAAAVVLLVAYAAWSSLRQLDAEVDQRQQQLAQLEQDVARADHAIARTERVDQFLDGGVIWLDEFRRLAERMPPADQVIINSITGRISESDRTGRLDIDGRTKQSAITEEMAAALRDDERLVTTSGTSISGGDTEYRWTFKQTVSIPPEVIRSQRYEAFGRIAEQDADAVEPDDRVSDQLPARGEHDQGDQAGTLADEPPTTDDELAAGNEADSGDEPRGRQPPAEREQPTGGEAEVGAPANDAAEEEAVSEEEGVAAEEGAFDEDDAGQPQAAEQEGGTR